MGLDEVAEFNRKRWDALSEGGVLFGRPWLELTAESARERVDLEGVLGGVDGKDVLLLAGGGGQQSAAFGLLGAHVTVYDLSEKQLDADRLVAGHYGLEPALIQGDMRDLSRFEGGSFDLVWHAHSLGFVPDPRPIFRGVFRILRRRGLYRLSCPNPFTSHVDENSWTGEGYLIRDAYCEGCERDPGPWEIWTDEKSPHLVQGPREFGHSLSTLVNVPLELGFTLRGIWEDGVAPKGGPPGSWPHLTTICPPHLVLLWDKT
jgi:SAM-dependent methyltransferase